MPAERVSMRRIREILRLKHECRATDREIARSLSVARSTVALTLERVAAAGSALAVAGDADRPCAGGDAVCRPRWSAGRAAQGGPRLGACPSRAAPLILESRPHPEQGYRACIGILRLARHYGAERLEAACNRGLEIGARSYSSIQSILKHGLDRRPPRPAAQRELLLDHPNIRGPRYYH